MPAISYAVKTEREVPYCTICLVVTCLICHTMVLTGNLTTANSIYNIGVSTEGWSNVGAGLGDAMVVDLDMKMSNITKTLSDAIAEITEVQHAIDTSFTVLGQLTGDSLDRYMNTSSQGRATSLLQLGHPHRPGHCQHEVALPETGHYMTGTLEAKTIRFKSHFEDNLNGFKSRGFQQVPALSTNVTQSFWEVVMHGAGKKVSREEFIDRLSKALDTSLGPALDIIQELLQPFWVLVKPSLMTVSHWLVTFASKFQEVIDQFSQTLDKVQKVFDQIMASVSGAANLQEKMVSDTYSMFALTHPNGSSATGGGVIVLNDLKTVARQYGFTTLQGVKATQLFRRYDADNDGILRVDEYSMLVKDPDVPAVMPVVLRTFASQLSVVAGQVGSGKLRQELAQAVALYLKVASTRDLSDIRRNTIILTNQSLDIGFSAMVLKELAELKLNPNIITTIDAGQLVVSDMMEIQPVYFKKIYANLSDPGWFESEGYDVQKQSAMVEQVTKWVTVATASKQTGTLLLQTTSDSNVPAMARVVVDRAVRMHMQKRREHRAALLQGFYTTPGAQALRRSLLGGVAASANALDPTQVQAKNKGKLASPQILSYAHDLSASSTATSKAFLQQCFDYEKASSAQQELFANKIQAVIKKVQSFLTTMQQFGSPEAINRTETMIMNFADQSIDEVKINMMKFVEASLGPKYGWIVQQDLANTSENKNSTASLLEKSQDPVPADAPAAPALNGVTSAIITQTATMLNTMSQAFPGVIDNLKFARNEVSGVSKTLRQIFSVFKVQGPPVLTSAGTMYKNLWIMYYVLFFIITGSLLFYAFWSCGWFGGPQPVENDGYQAPTTCWGRMKSLGNACLYCLVACHDNTLAFWSCIILSELIVLASFMVSIVLGVVGGLRMFMGAGCSQIYILGDNSICSGMLGNVKNFLESFLGEFPNFDQFCEDRNLLTCDIIKDRVISTLIMTGVCAQIAAALNFQQIVEAAILHERSVWRRAFDEEAMSKGVTPAAENPEESLD